MEDTSTHQPGDLSTIEEVAQIFNGVTEEIQRGRRRGLAYLIGLSIGNVSKIIKKVIDTS